MAKGTRRFVFKVVEDGVEVGMRLTGNGMHGATVMREVIPNSQDGRPDKARLDAAVRRMRKEENPEPTQLKLPLGGPNG